MARWSRRLWADRIHRSIHRGSDRRLERWTLSAAGRPTCVPIAKGAPKTPSG